MKQQQGHWQLVAQQSTRVQSPRTAIIPNPKVLDSYAGRYELASGGHYTLAREGSVLIARGGDRELTLIPESETKFFAEGMDAQWTFYKDERGATNEVGIRIGTGQELRGRKVK